MKSPGQRRHTEAKTQGQEGTLTPEHSGSCHEGQDLVPSDPSDLSELTYQGEDYEKDGVGPVLGICRNHNWEENGETETRSQARPPL